MISNEIQNSAKYNINAKARIEAKEWRRPSHRTKGLISSMFQEIGGIPFKSFVYRAKPFSRIFCA
jgi:hypothetical protein